MPSVLMLLARTTAQAMFDNRVLKEARALARAGYTVDILLFGQDVNNTGLDGAIQLLEVKVGNDWRLAAPLSSRLERAKILRGFLKTRAYSVIHCHDFLMLETAYWARAGRVASLIYDSHELFLDSIAFANATPLKRGLFALLEWLYVRQAAAILTVSPSIRETLSKYPVRLVEVIENIPDWDIDTSRAAHPKRSHDSNSHIELVYQGVLSRERGLEILYECLCLLPLNYRLTLIGEASTETIKYFSPLGSRVRFVGLVPHVELRQWLSEADIGVYPIQDRCLSYRYCLPNKLFEAILSGLPVIVSDFPDMANIVSQYGVGQTVPADEPAAFAQAIIHAVEQGLVDAWQVNCNERAIPHLTWKEVSRKLLWVYETAAKR